MNTFTQTLLGFALVACLMGRPALANAPTESADPLVQFENCLDAAHCTFLYGSHKVTVALADVDAPKLEGRCIKEIVSARHARDEVIVLLRSAESITLELAGTPDAAGVVTGRVIADGIDVGHQLIKRRVVGSKASWMHKSWC